jgi:hypothetical protein
MTEGQFLDIISNITQGVLVLGISLLIAFATLLVIWLVSRIISTGIFVSFYRVKQHFEKEDEDGTK